MADEHVDLMTASRREFALRQAIDCAKASHDSSTEMAGEIVAMAATFEKYMADGSVPAPRSNEPAQSAEKSFEDVEF